MDIGTTLATTTVLVVVGTTELKQIVNGGGPTFKPVIGGFLLGIGLFAIDALNPELGKLFGVLVLTTAVLVNGGPIFAKIGGKQT